MYYYCMPHNTSILTHTPGHIFTHSHYQSLTHKHTHSHTILDTYPHTTPWHIFTHHPSTHSHTTPAHTHIHTPHPSYTDTAYQSSTGSEFANDGPQPRWLISEPQVPMVCPLQPHRARCSWSHDHQVHTYPFWQGH